MYCYVLCRRLQLIQQTFPLPVEVATRSSMPSTECMLCHQPVPPGSLKLCGNCSALSAVETHNAGTLCPPSLWGTSRRSIIKALAGLFVAGSAISWLEACASPANAPARSAPQPTSTPFLGGTPPRIGTTLLTYYGQPDFKVDPIAWSPDGRRIACGYIAGSSSVLQVWSAVTGETLLSCRHGENVFGVAWSPDSKRVASGGGDNLVRIWDASRDESTIGTILLTYKGHSDSVVGIAWSPGGKRVASGSTDTTVQLWDAITGRTQLIYRGYTGSVIAVSWSPDGKRLVSASADATVQLWDAITGRTQLIYKGHSEVVFGVAWSPDGRRIASASRDKTVQVWDATTGATVLTYRGHTSPVTDVAWSPDGRRIASSGGDATVQVWDATSGRPRFTYRRHTDVVFDLAWSPDGTRIASASADTTARVWQAV